MTGKKMRLLAPKSAASKSKGSPKIKRKEEIKELHSNLISFSKAALRAADKAEREDEKFSYEKQDIRSTKLSPEVKLLISLRRLGKDFGFSLEKVPVFVFDLKSKVADGGSPAPAFTTKEGIYLSEDVLKTEPENAHVYLAHEIFHHVVENVQSQYKMDPTIRNYAIEYYINGLILDLFEYDVHKVKTKGLLNTKYKGLSLVQIVLDLKRKATKTLKAAVPVKPDHSGLCVTLGLAHPEIQRCVSFLRKKYANSLGTYAKDLFYMDQVDFENWLVAAPALVERSNLNSAWFVDVTRTMKGVWHGLYAPSAVHQPVSSKTLDIDQTVGFSLAYGKFRDTTEGDPEMSAWAVLRYLEALDLESEWLKHRLNVLLDKIRQVSSRIKEAHARSLTKTASREEATRSKLLKRYAALKVTKPLVELLPLQQVAVGRAVKQVVHVSGLKSSHPKRGSIADPSIKLPRFDATHEIVRRLRKLGTKVARQTEKIKPLLESLERFSNSSPLESSSTMLRGTGQESLDKNIGLEKDSLSTASKDPIDVEKIADRHGKAVETDIDDTEDSQVDGQKGRGSGKGVAANVFNKRLSLMERVGQNMQFLENLFKLSGEFESKLRALRKIRSGNSPAQDQLLALGDNMQTALPSELALLHDEILSLDFYVRLSQGSLLQENPPQRKRFPIILVLDKSGSMGGQRYVRMLAFSIAMLKILSEDLRGVALINFNGGISSSLVVPAGSTTSKEEFLKFICTSASGGTNFEIAFHALFNVRDSQNWTNAVGFFVTDGEDTIGVEALRILKTRKGSMKIIGCLTGRSAESLKNGLIDSVFDLKKDSMAENLTIAGASLL